MSQKKREVKETRQTERVPFGTFQKEMTIPGHLKKPGYMQRWINAPVGQNRLEAAKAGGWRHIVDNRTSKEKIGEGTNNGNTDIGSVISKVVDKKTRLGEPLRAYLMEIRQEYWEEDQRAKMARVDQSEQAIKRDKPGIKKEDAGDFYGKLKID
jgi:hypothetical protein